MVHRDVKPNNVMLDSDYNAHLGDFGLARLLQTDASVTTMLAGTPGYLAPEVGFTGKATPESDVYSFGHGGSRSNMWEKIEGCHGRKQFGRLCMELVREKCVA